MLSRVFSITSNLADDVQTYRVVLRKLHQSLCSFLFNISVLACFMTSMCQLFFIMVRLPFKMASFLLIILFLSVYDQDSFYACIFNRMHVVYNGRHTLERNTKVLDQQCLTTEVLSELFSIYQIVFFPCHYVLRAIFVIFFYTVMICIVASTQDKKNNISLHLAKGLSCNRKYLTVSLFRYLKPTRHYGIQV